MGRRVEVRITENGKPVAPAIAASWMSFLNGKWTRERPTRPGKYIIANRSGRVVGEVFVFYDAETDDLAVRIRDGALCKIKEFEDQHVWWWSNPMPLLMPISVPPVLNDLPTREEVLGSKEEWETRAKVRAMRERLEREAQEAKGPRLALVPALEAN